MGEWEVGALVRCPARPDWGVGQIQSVVGERVTVMFEEGGKIVFRMDQAEDPLTPARAPE